MKASERLLAYVKFHTTSDEGAEESVCPSTPRQKDFARALVREMQGLGMKDARVDENGYVYGALPAAGGVTSPALGLIAHMDTSPSASGENVKPRIVHYDGGDLTLNAEKGIVMCESEFESLAENVGSDLIVTDGTTLLGADDKAGIAEILTAVETLQRQALPHAELRVAFTPDEEIGRGADRFDLTSFGAKYAYTVDGGALGQIEYENFNAASAAVTIHGVNIHPGSAKNKMKNALLIAMEFNAMLPPHEIPACTEGYEGFHHLEHLSGAEELAEMHYIIRDHDRAKFEEKKARFEKIAGYLNGLYGEGTVVLTLRDSYYNMKEKITPYPFLIENARRAMEAAGAAPKETPIRGGTDGARLSFMGLPCPNLSTGGYNFHGRFEYIPVQSMDAMVRVLTALARLPLEPAEKG